MIKEKSVYEELLEVVKMVWQRDLCDTGGRAVIPLDIAKAAGQALLRAERESK